MLAGLRRVSLVTAWYEALAAASGVADYQELVADSNGIRRSARSNGAPVPEVSALSLSIFDLFKIGIGPSSSHTVGPMVAARRFLLELETHGLLERSARVETALFGSLALTGKGHATDKAIILGLCGEQPESVDADKADDLVAAVRDSRTITLLGKRRVSFDEAADLLFKFGEILPKHPNGITFRAFDEAGAALLEGNFYSVGGGFVLSEAETEQG